MEDVPEEDRCVEIDRVQSAGHPVVDGIERGAKLKLAAVTFKLDWPAPDTKRIWRPSQVA